MKSSVCVDASLIVRAVVPGPFTENALTLLSQWQSHQVTLIAPALCAFEVTSTFRRLVYLKELTLEEGEEAFTTFLSIPIHLSHSRSIFAVAWHLAKVFNRQRAYDTAYLALAQLRRCEFWTADEKLFNTVNSSLPWVKWVGNHTV